MTHDINVVDASGFEELLEKHSRIIGQQVDKAQRNSNQRIGG